jgi:hypothetical protein
LLYEHVAVFLTLTSLRTVLFQDTVQYYTVSVLTTTVTTIAPPPPNSLLRRAELHTHDGGGSFRTVISVT